MPLFDFKCPHCGRIEEVLVRTADQPPPTCGHVLDADNSVVFRMERQLAAPSFTVKGFSAINNYSKTDTGWEQSKYSNIKTRVADASGEAKHE